MYVVMLELKDIITLLTILDPLQLRKFVLQRSWAHNC
jgi:hypothetical protein